MALFLRIRTGRLTTLLLTVIPHLKIDWCKVANDLSLKRRYIELPPFFTASKIFTCFTTSWIFLGIPYLKAIFDLGLSISTPFSALYLPLTDFVFNFHLVAIVAMMQSWSYRKQVWAFYTQEKTIEKNIFSNTKTYFECNIVNHSLMRF